VLHKLFNLNWKYSV